MRRTKQLARLLASAGVTACLLTACGGGSGHPKSGGTGHEKSGGPGRTGPGEATATPTAKAYDPPLKFEDPASQDIAGGLGEGSWSVRLDGAKAYAASGDEVKAVDALDGKQLWSVKPQGQPSDHTDYGTDDVPRPTLVPVDGKPAVLAAFAVTVPGTGTTPDRPRIEVTAVDAASGKRVWTTTFDRPAGDDDSPPVIVGSDGNDAVVSLGQDENAVTFGIAFATRTTAWTAKGFAARFADDGVVVGFADTNGDADGGTVLEGIGSADGKRVWSQDVPKLATVTVKPVGGGLFTVEWNTPGHDPQFTEALLAASTGRPPVGFSAASVAGLDRLTCQYDERTTLVCTSEPAQSTSKRVFALDSKTFNELWSIDEKNGSRLVPEVSTVWHGAVYGETDNGSVVLDARSGKDRATNPGVTPFEVSEYAGLVKGSLGIVAHRALG